MPETSQTDVPSEDLMSREDTLKQLLEALNFVREYPHHPVYYTPKGTQGGDEGIEPASRMLDSYVQIEANRVRQLANLAADRIDQDVTSLSFDSATGQVLGALSDAARAAKYAIQQRIIAMGGEDLGWGR